MHLVFEYALAGIPMAFEADPRRLAELQGLTKVDSLTSRARVTFRTIQEVPGLFIPPAGSRPGPSKKRPAAVLHPNVLPSNKLDDSAAVKRARLGSWDPLLSTKC